MKKGTKTFKYCVSCIESTSDLINAMTENSRPVNFETFNMNCDLLELSIALKYSVGHEQGLHLKDDEFVEYRKSKYNNNLCYYMVHSRIEYIFIKGELQ